MSAMPDLPPPDDDALAHSGRLLDRIRDEIERQDGWMSFERYMEMALYEPGLGYYSAGSRKLGAEGDFVTAPEISPLFSRCLASQCAEILGALGGGDILELGAGSGIMAADVLAELREQSCLPRRYLILEVSADLRARQRATLQARVPDLMDRIFWLDAAAEPIVGIVLANEVLDALPVQRFRIRGPHVNALGVSWQLGRLDWSEVRASRSLENTVRSIELTLGHPLPDGYTSEVNQRLAPWLQTLSQSLHRGVMLFIDYGLPRAQYYRAERMTGTLLCHYRHRFHDDPFRFPGLQDIGAWVDFSAVAASAIG
jgi:SAM-dependent MidA family methyltransferase